jgi:HEAT repeat protein
MTPEERSLVRAMYIIPGRDQALSNEEFLRQFGAADGVALGVSLLQDATERHDPLDVDLALFVCFRFGFTERHLESLLILAFADWHKRHEDVASALGDLKTPTAVDALLHLASWVPSYLDFDDARALAVKAIWALGGIADDSAKAALKSLTTSDNEIVAENAVTQLQR